MTNRSFPVAAAVVLLSLAGGTACHRAVPASRAAPAPLDEHYCWWAVFRTTLPPDSVAVHFVNAFGSLGLTKAASEQRGDTVWAQAGPTRLDGWHGGTFSARVVAYRMGDSTHFRHFVGVAPPAGGWPAAYDSITADGRHLGVNPAGARIGLCGALGRAAQVHGTAPGEPDGEEKLELWTRKPPED